jgi:uncharacterized membrane protein
MMNRIKPHVEEELAEIEGNRSLETVRADLELQLADVLYKRAQAKLLIESDESNIESALVDALRVRIFNMLAAVLLPALILLLRIGNDLGKRRRL